MKQIVIFQDDNLENALLLTSLIKKLKDNYKIHCICSPVSYNILRFNKNINIYDINNVNWSLFKDIELSVNYSVNYQYALYSNNIIANKKLGFGLKDGYIRFHNQGAKNYYMARYIGIPINANIFQLIFGLSELTWEGEGYDLNYYPKNKCRKNIGLAVRNNIWKNHIENNLNQNIWYIPFKQNILKQIDEINICKHIITDSYVVMHIALALRKNVEFLTDKTLPYKIETFGKGNLHIISNFKEQLNV